MALHEEMICMIRGFVRTAECSHSMLATSNAVTYHRVAITHQ